MKKSVYSLVLMDDVVRAVDKQAILLGTSRSNLINQILAEHLSCITPEMRMKEIFSSVTKLLDGSFQIQPRRSDSLITLRTALEYKYRPTISYKVELLRSPDIHLGTLKAQIRTQNASLIGLFNSFFVYWISLENEVFRQLGLNGCTCELTSGCFTRRLLNCGEQSYESSAEAIYSYITLLDKAVKLYFSAPQSFAAAAEELKTEYARQLQHIII